MTTIRMAAAALVSLVLLAGEATAQKKYDPGASDTSIHAAQGHQHDDPPDDYQPMEEMALQRFNGERFEVFGGLLSARFD
jgi:hypothetical protein